MTRLSVRAQVRLRWIASLVVGIAVGAAAAPPLGVAAGFLAGWTALAITVLSWTLLTVWNMGPEETRDHATAEDTGRNLARIVAILGSVVSLAAVGVVMVQGRQSGGVEALVLAGIAVLSVVSSWALIQTNYLLHYAQMYYQGGPGLQGGISFNQRADPQYTDFAYFSVGLGMTYQVADTAVTNNAIRRIVIGQTLLAYLFGSGILATVINLVAGLG
ncbi:MULTISPECIES: DUF1345 domain-containing protein [unclassified Leucobacter]|uniref:DUF1345 domain-containing protein n=1 Tax=unclassified Leucobacter TaxID=2621730 RepID=UPI00165D4613|nr:MULTISPECIES: DUF1345 domain-containing protein [unclassified Leucobacter]MBC9928192.1 DUF1345 domain-containing protein [Leucobacter sp. cx-169]